MRQRLIYVLKHNKIMQWLYITVMSAVFRVLGHAIRTEETLVLIVSMMGKSYGDSPKVLFEYMQSHPQYRNYRCVWAFEDPAKFPEVESVKIDTWAYFKLSLRAKYWITNTNIERGLHYKKKNQVYLNTWHGIPLKTIGNDCPGRKDFDYRNVDALVVSGAYEEKIFHTAFRAEERNYLRSGMPRNERLWHATEEEKRQMRERLGVPEGKKVILYAPTWRESTDGGKNYEIKPPIHFDLWKRELGDEYIVLFRAHHQTTKVLGVVYDEFVRDASAYPDVNDLMIASDLLITDYSAIAFDYSILCRPILCYAYDYDSYLAERGVYFRIDEKYPNKSCRTEEELLERVKGIDVETECRNTKRFRDEFVQYGMGATEACVKALFAKN